MPVPASWPISCVVLRCFGSISLVIMYSKGLGKPLPFHKDKLLNQLVTVVLILLKVFHQSIKDCRI